MSSFRANSAASRLAAASAGGKRIAVTIAELAIGQRVTLATSTLGVCVAIGIADDERGLGGVVHALLPSARLDPRRAALRPATFVDTAIPALIAELVARGAVPGRLTAWLVGGANVSVDPGALRIGDQNVEAVHRALRDAKVPLLAAAVGGSEPRSLRLEIGRRCVAVRGPMVEEIL